MKFKAILFDMDGVLIDSFYAWFHLFNDSLEHFGLQKITEKEFREKVWGGPIEKDIKIFFKKQSIDEVAGYYFSNFNKFNRYLRLFPETKKVLKELKNNGAKLGLVTNTFSKVTNDVLRYFDLLHYFDAVVSGDDVSRGKPEPDMMLKACEKMKVSPKETILVGDTHNDMIAGKRAGCYTVGFRIDGDQRIEKLDEVSKFV